VYKKALREFFPLVLYALSFGVLTWPLIRYFAVGISGFYNSDAPIFLWNAWEWQKKLLLGDWSFVTRDLFFPHATSLILHTHTQIQSLLAAVFNLVFKNLVFSFNLVYLLSAVAGAYFAFLFFRLLTKNYWAALLAGQYFGFQHLWGIYSLFGTQNLLGFWYIPAVLYGYEAYCQKKRWGYLVWAGAVLGLAFLNEFIIFVYAVAVLVVFALTRMIFMERFRWKEFFKQTAIGVVSFLAVSGWKILVIIQDRAAVQNIALPTMSDVDFYHADFINLIRPSRLHGLWGNLGYLFRPVDLSAGNAFIGFTFVAVVLLFLFWRYRTKIKLGQRSLMYVLLIGYGVMLIMACGPYWHIWGYNTGVPMPHWFLAKISSQFNNLRMPARWLIPATIFLAGILALFLGYVFDKIKSKKILAVIISALFVGLILDSFFLPKSILFVNNTVSPVYEQIKQVGGGVVVEIPLAITSGYFSLGESSRVSMLHQTIHEQPILGGHLSRLPFSVRDNYEREPVIKYLVHYRAGGPAADDLAPEKIKKFFDYYQPRYFILDKQLDSFRNASGQVLINYLTENLELKFYYEDSEVLVFIK